MKLTQLPYGRRRREAALNHGEWIHYCWEARLTYVLERNELCHHCLKDRKQDLDYRSLKQRILCAVWRFVFRKWLDEKDIVIKVKGWRTALIDAGGYSRRSMTPIFWWFK